MSEELRDDKVVLLRNEAPLTIVMRIKETSFPCGTPFPLESGEPADVRLATAYVFYGNSSKIERLYQMRNYSNKDLKTEGFKKLNGGQLLTDWPRPHYLKQYQKWVKWDDKEAQALTSLPYSGSGQTADTVDVRASGSMILSTSKTPAAGRTIAIKQSVTPNAGEYLGSCLCQGHGGLMLNGSLLAGQDIKAMQEDKAGLGPEQMRTITLDGSRVTLPPAAVKSLVIEMETLSNENRELGSKGPDGVTVVTNPTLGTGGYLLFKSYQTLAGPIVGQAVFNISIDVVNAPDDDVAEIDVTWKGSFVLAKRMLKRSDFFVDGQYQRFVLVFELPEKSEVEPRVRWLNKAAMAVDSVIINSAIP